MNIQFKNLQIGEVLSETSFYKVEKVVGNDVQLGTESGESVVLDKGYTESFLKSARQSTQKKTVTKTEMAAIFLSNPNVAMKLSFNKKVDEKEVLKEIMDTHSNSAPKDVEKNFKTTLKKALKGEERIIEGRHFGNQDDFGRVSFIDMQITRTPGSFDNRSRLVDPREINWLIVDGTEYKIK